MPHEARVRMFTVHDYHRHRGFDDPPLNLPDLSFEYEILKTALLTWATEGVDYFMLDKSSLWYSKYCSGGSYEVVGSFCVEELTFIFASTRPVSSIAEFDLRDPDAYMAIGKDIKSIIDTIQIKRRPW